ncbi:MAG: MerR family transcriptional regulator [Planctomycetota bacterium]|nr:MerR family transcriptional regulator [Planctomycetota bacterium]
MLERDATLQGSSMGEKTPEIAEGGRSRPRKLYRIGEVMEYAKLSRQTVHNYTVMGLISEADRTRGNQRLYGEEVFERLAKIAELKKKGFRMADIRRMLAEEEKRS